MKRLLSFPRLLFLIILCFLMLAGIGNQAVRADGIAPGHILVRVQPGVDAGQLAADYGTSVQDHVSNTTLYSIAIPNGSDPTTFSAVIGADPRVVYAEPDQIVASPEVRGEPFHFAFDLTSSNTTYANSVVYKQVDLGKADSYGQTNPSNVLSTGKGVVVAVLDTGATFSHPDLIGHYLSGYNAISPDALPIDAPDGITNYEVGHGTMVSGIIARLAPQAQIMPVRVLNGDGSGTILSLVSGLHYATTHGAQVINMSFGCSVSSSALNDALDEAELAGVVLVASAGNDNSTQVFAPTTSRGTLAVAAVESNNTKSPYSNYGSWVQVVAPGSGIRSTYWDGGYATWSGTSFAAPFVAATAALMISYQPGLTADTVRSVLRKTARPVDNQNPLYKGLLGRGIIDIESAVKSSHL